MKIITAGNKLVWLALGSVLVFACKKDSSQSITPPSPPDSLRPGKRDYVWTVDTITYPGSFQTDMRGIWGSGPNDVYIVGHNDRAGMGTMYHFNGVAWVPVKLLVREGGTIQQGFDLLSIYGSGPNDIYAVGNYIYENPSPPPNFLDSSLILHFDGASWREIQVPLRGRGLIGVWSPDPATVYAGGISGTSYVCSGGTWSFVQSDTSFWFADFSSCASGVYAVAYYPRPGFGEKDYFLHWSNSRWAIVDSFSPVFTTARFGIYALRNIGDALLSVGPGVFRWEESTWTRIFNSSLQTLIGLFGTRSEHLFAVGTSGSVYHYNGTDWYEYPNTVSSDLLCSGVWCTENEVFVVASDGNRTFVYHGK